jgi:hypothetical protein
MKGAGGRLAFAHPDSGIAAAFVANSMYNVMGEHPIRAGRGWENGARRSPPNQRRPQPPAGAEYLVTWLDRHAIEAKGRLTGAGRSRPKTEAWDRARPLRA